MSKALDLSLATINLPDCISPVGFEQHLRVRMLRPDDRAAAVTLSERQDAVAVFRVNGVLSADPQWYDEISSTQLAADLRAATADEKITAGLLVIDSPGGYSPGMLELAAAAAAFNAAKPLDAHVTGTCCSAAYWLASQCRAIYAGPRDNVGSIGVYQLNYDLSEHFAAMGIEAVHTKTGPLKAVGVLGAKITDEQRAWLQERVDATMADFSAAVRTGRSMSAEQFAKVSDGRYWFANEAASLGLIDGIQSIQKTLAGLSTSAKPKRSNAMADEHDATPKAATHKELKASMPEASADFILSQLEASATVGDALKAYNTQLAAELKASKEAAAASEEKVNAAEAKAAAASVAAGKKTVAGLGVAEGETVAAEVDYHEQAHAYQEKHKCRWSEACLEIKRRYPEAREAFGAPAKS